MKAQVIHLSDDLVQVVMNKNMATEDANIINDQYFLKTGCIHIRNSFIISKDFFEWSIESNSELKNLLTEEASEVKLYIQFGKTEAELADEEGIDKTTAQCYLFNNEREVEVFRSGLDVMAAEGDTEYISAIDDGTYQFKR